MSDIPSDLRYTEEHEYLKSAGDDGLYFVGITEYAHSASATNLDGPAVSTGAVSVL